MAKIDVIIPTYNRLTSLRRAVASIQAQSFKDWELWIVDDGSTDESYEWIKSLESPKIHGISQPNLGVSTARNRGIEASESPWIAFLDSDDEWLPKKLEQQMKWAARHPEHPLIHTEEIWIRNGVRVNAHKKHQKSGGRIFSRCLPLCCVSPSASLVRRDLFSELGLFREDFVVCEDYELWLRICAKYEVGFLPTPLIKKYGGHEDQLSHQFHSMDYWRIKALSTHFDSQWISEKERHELLETVLKKCKILLAGYEKHQNFKNFEEIAKIQAQALGLFVEDSHRFALPTERSVVKSDAHLFQAPKA